MKALLAIVAALGFASISATAEAGHRSYGHGHHAYGHVYKPHGHIYAKPHGYAHHGYGHAHVYRHAPVYGHVYAPHPVYKPAYVHGYAVAHPPIVIVKPIKKHVVLPVATPVLKKAHGVAETHEEGEATAAAGEPIEPTEGEAAPEAVPQK